MSKLKVFRGTRYYTCSEEVYVVAKSMEEAEEKLDNDQAVTIIDERSDLAIEDTMISEQEIKTITIQQIGGVHRNKDLPLKLCLIPESNLYPLEDSFCGHIFHEEVASIEEDAFSYPKSAWELVPEPAPVCPPKKREQPLYSCRLCGWQVIKPNSLCFRHF